MAILNDIPPELLSAIFAHLNLTSLIRARCVSRLWRSITLTGTVDPIRWALYELFLAAINSPALASSREWIEAHCVSFDRQVYLSSLSNSIGDVGEIPEEFRMWILEWPAKVAIGSSWPGISWEHKEEYGSSRRLGWNYLAVIPPQLYQLHVCPEEEEVEPDIYPVLPVWAGDLDCQATFLFLGNRPSLRGKVLYTDIAFYEIFVDMFNDTGPDASVQNKSQSDREFVENWGYIYSGWVRWLWNLLDNMNKDTYLDSYSLRQSLREGLPYIPQRGGEMASKFIPWITTQEQTDNELAS